MNPPKHSIAAKRTAAESTAAESTAAESTAAESTPGKNAFANSSSVNHAAANNAAPTDQQRALELRKHKIFVTSLLVLAAAIFLGCSWWQSQPGDTPGWVGYVRAAAEAGMVGGLADWFAVTALFRHPMGLPIPHTALIRKKKDQLGDSLSQFVGDNFLNAELITSKVRAAKLPEWLGAWLSERENAEKVSREVGKLTTNIVRAIDAQEAEELIQRHLIDKAAEPIWGPPLGRTLDALIDEGKLEPVVDEVVTWAKSKIDDSEESIVTLINDRMPTWAPRFARQLVGEKVFREMASFIREVEADPQHPARKSIRKGLRQLAYDLQFDATMISRVEEWKAEIRGSRAVKALPEMLWDKAATGLLSAAEDPESTLRQKIVELCVRWGENIRTDAELRASLDRRINSAVEFLANNYSSEVTGLISETIARWDADEASEKIELMVGKDLQFIRLNGTVVGALAGLVIYTVNQLLFGA
ncbi:DUF445 domain-containing protein [Corynebacterium pseudodiphtheriticum]|uniref:DUF445 domain-containing protein n=1 Tax=Corynebacterium pseudodiphtheriticum TaxID=37637 RepID=UPI001EE8FCF9|nr:DUF445 family protein [Corynebacterium pseudodiphtheriticum]MDK4304296.1 DUF445 family protein [Corynebacterium pseudodiphtheriticum]